MSEDEWFSDAALAKQAAITNRPEGEPARLTDLFGVWEPRVPATDEERCPCCGLDAREGAGGNGRYCGICIGRGHDEDDALTLAEWNAANRRARIAYASRPATRWCAWSEQCWGEAGSDGVYCPSHQVWARRKGIR